MRRGTVLWILALLVTLAAAAYQERTGPTFPIRTRVTLGGQAFPVQILRSWSDGDQPIELTIADPSVSGRVRWRRFPSSETWQVQGMRRSGDALQASLPHQPPAGKLEYQMELARAEERVIFPDRPAVTRFKGNVSPAILVPHIFAMFLGMLFSTRAGLEALVRGPGRRWMTMVALGLLLVGGCVLGPLVQKAAFGAYWTGVPWGYDLTDNKTLIAVAAWLFAAWQVSRRPTARWSLVLAALVTLVVFAIPHSVWGSEIKWE
jgi:hypothetical protein